MERKFYCKMEEMPTLAGFVLSTDHDRFGEHCTEGNNDPAL
jgi:hypothetical protein